jgi:predicted O-methyltransferase YrrM
VLKEMMGEDCKTYLEIGTHNGGSMMTVMQSKHKTKFFGVDVWWQDSNRVMAQQNISKKNVNNHEFTLIKGNSMLDETFVNVEKFCPSIDFLFIDGGHNYENALNDFNRYSKLVSKHGLIVFDDYLFLENDNRFTTQEKERKGQVKKAVDDIVKNYGSDYNVIGILPNEVKAQSKRFLDYNVSFIMQKL